MNQALLAAAFVVAVGSLPGAILFRLPFASRGTRAALPAEERAFWYVTISVCWSVGLTLALAALSWYSPGTLLLINAGLAVTLIAVFRGRLRLGVTAQRIDFQAVLPLVLVALCAWRFFPAAEYVIGGKDPGVYVNEGISMHRTGTLFRHDNVVSSVPEDARDLFFRSYGRDDYYSVRFMGVFIMDPGTGAVMAGFPTFFRRQSRSATA